MKITIGNEKTKFLSDKMFGLFFEDINYGADGGLYAEMIENRQFAFRKSTLKDGIYSTEYAADYGWKKYSADDSCQMAFLEANDTNDSAVCDKNPHFMRFTAKSEAAFTNKAYDGVCMQSGKNYQLVMWIRNPEYAGKISLICKSADGKTEAVHCDINVTANKEWQKIEATVMATSTIKDGIFIICQDCGTVDYGYVSLMPCDAVAGVFRKDLFDMINAMRPGFLRFPGGCIVEGAVLSNRYNWKDTVGLPWNRRWNWSRWAVHDFYMGQPGTTPKYCPYYNQSYGIGFYEYFLISELMGAKALPVLSVGIACQFQTSELCPIDSPEFQDEYIQSALDLIEFANGDVSTKWGAIRAEMGHEKPFNLEFLGIGNEQWETETVDFFARYKAFEKAIHAKYPEIKLVSSAGPDVTSDRYPRAWNFYKEECPKNPDFTVAVDEHYYMPPEWFYEHLHMYDNFPREIPVFAGEYAAHCEKKQNNLKAALAEAAFMTGLERNGDVIRFASVAPLFARKNYFQWIPDFIWFDGDTVMGTPGYYVQKMYGVYTGNEYVKHEMTEAGEKMFASVSCDAENYYVKVINSSETETTLDSVAIEGKSIVLSDAKVMQLSGESLETVNVLGGDSPVKLEEVTEKTDVVKIPALSCSVLIIKK